MPDPQKAASDPWAVVKSERTPTVTQAASDDPWKVVSSESAPTSGWDTLKTIGSHVLSNLPNPVALYHLGVKMGPVVSKLSNPSSPEELEQAIADAVQFFGPNIAEGTKAAKDFSHAGKMPLGSPAQIGDVVSGAGHAGAAAIPFAGPAAANAGEEIGRGETAAGLTDAAMLTVAPPLLGRATGAVARAVAPAVMEGAQRVNTPIAQKFDNLGATAVNNGILPTEAGAQRAQQIRIALQAIKENELRDSGRLVPTADVATPAMQRTEPEVASETRAGLRTPAQVPPTGTAFMQNNPPQIPAYQLDAIKSAWDDAQDASKRARVMGRPVTADDKEISNLSQSAGDQLAQALPDGRYRDLNQQIMNMEGVRQVSQRSADVSTNGLSSLSLAIKPSLAMFAFRAARIPAVAGTAAIGLDRSAPTLNAATRAAILAQLQQQSQPSAGGSS